ncbi:MAG: sulfite exporter TauE/SafE family protein [Planctomycetota bacterium]
MMPLWIGLIFFAAAFVQGLSGFGSALVAMPLLLPLLGSKGAAPLMALVAMPMQVILLVRYRRSLSLEAVWRLVVASVVMIPAGVFLAGVVPERVVFGVLGGVLIGYALYALADLKLPAITHAGWAYAAGAAAGVLGGAYNTDGPPVVVYGSCRRWNPLEFKSNLQGVFFVNSVVILGAHAAAGNLTGPVWGHFLAALPAVAAGAVAGVGLDRFVSATMFRRIMLALLLVLGVRLACRVVFGM